MPLSEILRIAFSSIGVNKLRSILTMFGITIGVFSVIGVMTAVTALRGSIELNLSYLGSNTFQFSKLPFASGGHDHRKYEMRRNITLDQARRYQQLMAGATDVICMDESSSPPAQPASAMSAAARIIQRMGECMVISLSYSTET